MCFYSTIINISKAVSCNPIHVFFTVMDGHTLILSVDKEGAAVVAPFLEKWISRRSYLQEELEVIWRGRIIGVFSLSLRPM